MDKGTKKRSQRCTPLGKRAQYGAESVGEVTEADRQHQGQLALAREADEPPAAVQHEPDQARGPVERVKVRITPDGRLSRVMAAKYLDRQPADTGVVAHRSSRPESVLIRSARRLYYIQKLDSSCAGGAGGRDPQGGKRYCRPSLGGPTT